MIGRTIFKKTSTNMSSSTLVETPQNHTNQRKLDEFLDHQQPEKKVRITEGKAEPYIHEDTTPQFNLIDAKDSKDNQRTYKRLYLETPVSFTEKGSLDYNEKYSTWTLRTQTQNKLEYYQDFFKNLEIFKDAEFSDKTGASKTNGFWKSFKGDRYTQCFQNTGPFTKKVTSSPEAITTDTLINKINRTKNQCTLKYQLNGVYKFNGKYIMDILLKEITLENLDVIKE